MTEWERSQHEGMLAIHRNWWGNEETSLVANKVIDGLPPLNETSGRYFIRQDDIATYERIEKAEKAGLRGSLINGQPGNGKTFQLYFFLAKRLSQKKLTFFTTTMTIHRFDAEGVFIASLDDRALIIESSKSRSPKAWVLIDWDSGNGEPPPPLTKEKLFTVQASYPDNLRYHSWTKRVVSKIITKRWTLDELKEGLLIQDYYERDVVPDDELRNAVAKWGWAPRDLFYAMSEKTKGCSIAALNYLTPFTLSALKNIFISTFSLQTEPNPISCVYRSIDSPSAEALYYDYATIDFISPYMLRRVSEKFAIARIPYNDAKDIFSWCRYTSDTSLLADWSFQLLATEIIRQATPDVKITLPSPLAMSATDNRTWNRTPSAPSLAAPTGLPSRSLEIRSFDSDFSSLDLSTKTDFIYVPAHRPNPLFDAFLLSDDEDGATVVHVLQITVAGTHRGSAKGLALLQKLRRRLIAPPSGLDTPPPSPPPKKRRTETAAVRFRYYLVSPSPATRPLTWELPRALPPALDGPFFVQHIPFQYSLFREMAQFRADSVEDEVEDPFLSGNWIDLPDYEEEEEETTI